MTKSLFSLLSTASLTLMLAFLLCACSSTPASPSSQSGAVAGPGGAASTASEGVREVESSSDTSVTSAPIEWKTIETSAKDAEGYTYVVSVKMSPWILLSNSNYIKSAWSEVGGGKELPEFDEWSLKKASNGYGRVDMPYASYTSHGGGSFPATEMTDMYYCVGTISVRNATEGWDITSSNSRSLQLPIRLETTDYYGRTVLGTCIGRVMYKDKTQDYAGGMVVNPSMQSNSWGPVPFVIMAPENFSPKTPDGEYREVVSSKWAVACEKGCPNEFEFESFNLSVIGKEM